MKCCMIFVLFAIAIGLSSGQSLSDRFNARKASSNKLLSTTTNLAGNRLGRSQSQYGLGNAMNGASPLSAMSMNPIGGRLGQKTSSMNMMNSFSGLNGFNGLNGYGALGSMGSMGGMGMGTMGGIGGFGNLGGMGMLGNMNSMAGLYGVPETKKPYGTMYNLQTAPSEEDEYTPRASSKRTPQGKSGKKNRQRQKMKKQKEEEEEAEPVAVKEVEEEAEEEVPPPAPKPNRGKKQQQQQSNRTRKLSKKNQRGKGKNQVIDAITLNQEELEGLMEAKKKSHEKPAVKPAAQPENEQVKKLSARRPVKFFGRLE